MSVYNEQGEKIGTFDDIMLPTAGGEVTAVISVGGFLSNGDKLVKIPLESRSLYRQQADDDRRWEQSRADGDADLQIQLSRWKRLDRAQSFQIA